MGIIPEIFKWEKNVVSEIYRLRASLQLRTGQVRMLQEQLARMQGSMLELRMRDPEGSPSDGNTTDGTAESNVQGPAGDPAG